MSDDFKNERILFIERSKEKTRRGVGRSRTMNKRNNKKSNASISSGKEGGGREGSGLRKGVQVKEGEMCNLFSSR